MKKRRLVAFTLTLFMLASMAFPINVSAADGVTWFGTTEEYPNVLTELYPNGYQYANLNYVGGVIDSAGNTLLPFDGNSYNEIAYGLFIVGKDRVYGVKNIRNEFVIPQKYASIERLDNGNYIVKENALYGLLSPTGETIIPTKCKLLNATDENTYVVDMDGAYHIMDANGNSLYHTDGSGLTYVGYGNYRFFSNGFRGTRNKNGTVIIPASFDIVGEFKEGITYVVQGERLGWYVYTGEAITGMVYGYQKDYVTWDSEYGFHNGMAKVFGIGEDNSAGYINTSGTLVIPRIYHPYSGHFLNGVAVACDWLRDGANKSVVIDRQGNVLNTLTTQKMGTINSFTTVNYYDDLQQVGYDHFGIIDSTGTLIIPMAHTNLYAGTYPGKVDPETGLLFLVEDTLETSSTKRSLVIYDRTGKQIVGPERYSVVSSVIAPTSRGGYIAVNTYENGLKSGHTGAIDLNGNVVIPFEYDKFYVYGGGLFKFGTDAYNMGLLNTKNEVVVPLQDDAIINTVHIIVRDGKVGYIRAEDLSPTVSHTYPVTKTPRIPVYDFTAPPTATPAPTTARVFVNGVATSFEAYTINDNNYFKLRDLAYVLNGVAKGFNVTWDGEKNAINLISGQKYTVVGGEMAKASASVAKGNCSICTSTIYIDGIKVSLLAYTIGDNNFFKLRDVMMAFDIGVGWDGEAGVITVDSTKSY